jgi:hypothetical protein
MPDASGYNAACCVAELDRIAAAEQAYEAQEAEAEAIAERRLTDPEAIAELFCDAFFNTRDCAKASLQFGTWIAEQVAAGTVPACVRDALRTELADDALWELRKASGEVGL